MKTFLREEGEMEDSILDTYGTDELVEDTQSLVTCGHGVFGDAGRPSGENRVKRPTNAKDGKPNECGPSKESVDVFKSGALHIFATRLTDIEKRKRLLSL